MLLSCLRCPSSAALVGLALLTQSGCIFATSPTQARSEEEHGDTGSATDIRDGDRDSGDPGSVDATDTASKPADAARDGGEGDTADSGDDRNADAGDDATDDTGDEPDEPDAPMVVYVDAEGHLGYLDRNHRRHTLSWVPEMTGEIRAIGPGFDHDSDDTLELPYIVSYDGDDASVLRLADLEDETTTLLTEDVLTTKRYGRMIVADVIGTTDDRPELVFPGNDGAISYVEPGETEAGVLIDEGVDGNETKCWALLDVLSPGDHSGSSTERLYWVDDGTNVKYLSLAGIVGPGLPAVRDAEYPPALGNNSGYVGAGATTEFDDHRFWASIDGSAVATLTATANSDRTIPLSDNSVSAVKSPPAIVDTNREPPLEFLFVGSDHDIQFVPAEPPASSSSYSPQLLEDAAGDPISVKPEVGLAAGSATQ